ncbi:hypothetical protein ACP70R_022767 [Stipagrostis hirtigluma subsp. patula]
MASATTRLLLSAAALVSVLAAVSGSGPTWCVPGLAIPHNPLPSCYSYVASRACGVGSVLPLPLAKQRCCRELEDIAAYCRCGALRILMDGVIAPGGQMEGRLPDLPGCPREAQRGVAAGVQPVHHPRWPLLPLAPCRRRRVRRRWRRADDALQVGKGGRRAHVVCAVR